MCAGNASGSACAREPILLPSREGRRVRVACLSTVPAALRVIATMTRTSDERLRQGLEAIRVHVGQPEMDYIDGELAAARGSATPRASI